MSGVSSLAGCCLLILGSFAAAEIQLKIHWIGSNGTRQIFTPKEFAKLSEEDRTEHRLTKRNAIKDYKYLWHLGVVYYDIDARTADFRLLQILSPAFQFFEKYTCIRWKRRIPGDGHNDYVIFTMPYGNVRICNSAVGKQSGRQYINLDTECVKSLAIVLHQMTHALGFYHMHTRPDRDDYISVFPENAAPENRKFFDKESPDTSDTLGFPYEYKSLMHFDGFKYAKGFDPTIKGKVKGAQLGNSVALTFQDILMINKLYADCKTSCRFANGGCEHNCYDDAPGKVTCSCLQGYRLEKDQKTCFDVDECSENNGGCDHFCSKHGAWYRCSCRNGFRLHSNGYSCRANNLCETGALKCEQECNFNQCRCRSGYYLLDDKISCGDVNECHSNNGGCEGTCTNNVGSFSCSCPKGKYLSNDGKSCTAITCTAAPAVADAEITCTNDKMVDGTECTYSCKQGFKITGNNKVVCKGRDWQGTVPQCKQTDRCQLDNGGCEHLCWANTWTSIRCSCKPGFQIQTNGKNCTDIEPPTITKCPSDVYSNTVPKKGFAFVTWQLPEFYDNVGASIVKGPVMQDQIGGIFNIGPHTVDYTVRDKIGLESYCSFKIKVNDVEAPDMFNCPGEQTYEIISQQQKIEANWQEPSFWDNSGNVTVTTDLPSNKLLQPRSQEVHYIATDPSGNSVVCTVKVTVNVKEANCKTFPYPITGGTIQCDEFVFGTQCRPQCDSDYNLLNDGLAPYYTCYGDKWRPNPQPISCPDLRQPQRGPTLTYEVAYKHICFPQRTISISQLEKTATTLVQRYKKVLCPTAGDSCKLTVNAQVQCSKDSVSLLISTSEPVKSPATSRYMQQLKDNIRKNQSGLFLYTAIDSVVASPVANNEGLKAVPKIDFACKAGDKMDAIELKCYSN